MMGKAFVTLKEAPCTKRVHWGFRKRFASLQTSRLTTLRPLNNYSFAICL